MALSKEQIKKIADKCLEAPFPVIAIMHALRRVDEVATKRQKDKDAKIAAMFSINKTPIHPNIAWDEMKESVQIAVHTTAQQVAEAIREQK